MTGWVRLWHDMPTDPKWRVIAKRSGQTISEVMAVFNFVMVNASGNALKRGRTHNLFPDDIAAALDIETESVEAILNAMQGKVLDGEYLTGWEKRQPKREDSSTERVKAWRERNETQRNAEKRPEKEAEKEEERTPRRPPKGGVMDGLFERFWLDYPKREGANPRKPAFDKFKALSKAGDDPEAIIAGAKRYAHQCQAIGKLNTSFVAQAVTWLNQRRWEDYQISQPEKRGEFVRIRSGTPQWDAWLAHMEAKGEGTKFIRNRGEWSVPTEWPPKEQAA